MLAASLAAAPVDVSARELDSIRTFDEWVIGCDNCGTCNAVSLFPAETVLEGWYSRSPFPNTRPEVRTCKALAAAVRDEMIRPSAGYCDDAHGADGDSRNLVRLGPDLALASLPCLVAPIITGELILCSRKPRLQRCGPRCFPARSSRMTSLTAN